MDSPSDLHLQPRVKQRLTCSDAFLPSLPRVSCLRWLELPGVLCPVNALQLCPALCDPVDCSPPGSSVLGISQATILECVAKPSSRGSSWAREWTHISYISCTGRQVLYQLCHLGIPQKKYYYLLHILSVMKLIQLMSTSLKLWQNYQKVFSKKH